MTFGYFIKISLRYRSIRIYNTEFPSKFLSLSLSLNLRNSFHLTFERILINYKKRTRFDIIYDTSNKVDTHQETRTLGFNRSIKGLVALQTRDFISCIIG